MTALRNDGERFARRVFGLSGVYGLVVLLPQFFFEEILNRRNPPPITHPEYFYGFLGVAVAWQVAFLLIARDPVRLRPVILAGALEKFSFGLAAATLYGLGRINAPTLGFAAIDAMLGVLFIISYLRTSAPRQVESEAPGESASEARAGRTARASRT